MATRILIIYDTNGGNTYAMAQRIARGVDSVAACEAVIRTVPKVTATIVETAPAVPDAGAPYVELKDLQTHDGLIIGSPTHFGNMSAALKHFLDQTTPAWLSGALTGKPAAAFTSTGSMHGGQEATLLSMMIPLLHHGMLLCGLPYSHPGLMQTTRGGTPYGVKRYRSRALSLTRSTRSRVRQIAGHIMTRVGIARWTALLGYFGLLALLLNWFTWLAPPTQVPRSLLLIVLVVPLLFPLRGMLYARRYTHQWVSFLSLFYFAVGVDVWFNNPPEQAVLGALTVLFSLLLFVGSILYAKHTAQPRDKSPTA